MKFGLYLMNDFRPGLAPTDYLSEMRSQVEFAAEADFHSAWALQHFVGNMDTLQPLPLLSYLAPYSGFMGLGTCIFILPLRHPVAVAEDFATLDQLSGGRAIAGFGLGYRAIEFESFGVDAAERVSRFSESVAVIRMLWQGSASGFRGHHFSVPAGLRGLSPVQIGGPPVWVGAGAHAAGARRAAEFGDGWILTSHMSIERLAELIQIYRGRRLELACADTGQIAVIRDMLLDRDAADANRRGAAARAGLSRAYAAYNLPDGTASYRHLRASDESDIGHSVSLMTDPRGCRERLAVLRDIGVDLVIVRPQWFDVPASVADHSMHLFVDEVMPTFHHRDSA
jgi:alkanesulfonate monooxygenase SsuD/methylene tetrahydromethanopterin reductase-like flavin-dependent oxidoreductase (luciferase family)